MTQVKSVRSFRAVRARMLYGMEDVPPTFRGLDLTSSEKMIARRMARKPGCTYQDIAEAIGWPLSLVNLRRKLKKINIHCITRDLVGHLGNIDTRR